MPPKSANVTEVCSSASPDTEEAQGFRGPVGRLIPPMRARNPFHRASFRTRRLPKGEQSPYSHPFIGTENYCRFCGFKCTPRFCRRCGIAFGDDTASSFWRYSFYRLRTILSSLLIFLRTVLLLLRPVPLFRTLAAEGVGVHTLRLFTKRRTTACFSDWRGVTTPQSYLLIVLLFAQFAFFLDIDKKGIFAEINDKLVYDKLVWLKPILASIGFLLLELLLVFMLFVAYHLYRLLLGIRRTLLFSEVFLYSATQWLFLMTSLYFFTVRLPGIISLPEPYLGHTFFGAALALSVFYFLLTPLRLFPQFFSVSRCRIVVSYGLMIVLPVLLIVVHVALLFWAYSDSVDG